MLTALIELAVERHGAGGEVDTLTTRELATRVLELYWPQARAFHGRERLRQMGARGRSLIDRIAEFRQSLGADTSSPQLAARRSPAAYAALLDDVEWIVIRYPLPRLQRIGNRELELIYERDWTRAAMICGRSPRPGAGTPSRRGSGPWFAGATSTWPAGPRCGPRGGGGSTLAMSRCESLRGR
ncbi:MAG: hypothetical protein R6X02_27400 [Enhygromyxa sp.]